MGSLGLAESTDTARAAIDDAVATDSSAPSPADRRIVWAALGLGLLPFVVSAITLVVGVGSDYMPIGDQAQQEMHIRDIGHHEVLVGLWSHPNWSHPGPIFFYLSAPFYWLTGGSSIGMSLATLFVGGGSVAGMAILARRRGGTPLLLCTLVGCALVVQSLGADFLRDPWITYVPTLPFGLLLFLVWGLMCGDTWALPAAAFVASFLVQTHVGFLVLAIPLAAWGAAWLVVPGLRARQRRRRTLQAVAVSVVVLGIVWLPPVLDVVLHTHSNPTRTKEWFERTRLSGHSLGDGWRVVTSQFGWPPPWLTDELHVTRYQSQFLDSPLLPVLLVPVALAAGIVWRRRPVEGPRLIAVLSLAIVFGVVAIARTLGAVFEYRLGWTWIPAMLGFVLVCWAIWLTLSSRWAWIEARVLGPAALGVLAALAGVSGLRAAQAGTPAASDSEVVAALTTSLLDVVDPDEGQVVVLERNNGSGVPLYARALVLQLEKHGIDARVPRAHLPFFTEPRVQRPGPVQAFLLVVTGDEEEIDRLERDRQYRLVAEWSDVSEETMRHNDEVLERVEDDIAAGRLTVEEAMANAEDLFEDATPHSDATTGHAAVFIDLHPELVRD